MKFYISKFKDIERQEFECEIITPMFISGADKNHAELRAQSIKGLLRFWWRAINSNLVERAENNKFNYDNLLYKEAKLFGDAGSYFGKSKTKINIYNFQVKFGRFSPLPHKNVNFNFPCIYQGGLFKIKITSPKKVHILFKFLTIVGGIGKRSRRGFGSFKINDLNISRENLLEKLKYFIDEITFKNNYVIHQNKLKINNDKKVNYPYIKTIEIGKQFDNYLELLKAIGQTSHNYNSSYTGFINKKERLASPIYVSAFKFDNNYYPIITELNLSYKRKISGNDTRKDFIKNLK